ECQSQSRAHADAALSPIDARSQTTTYRGLSGASGRRLLGRKRCGTARHDPETGVARQGNTLGRELWLSCKAPECSVCLHTRIKPLTLVRVCFTHLAPLHADPAGG